MESSPNPKLGHTCVSICKFLGDCDATTEVLVEHCECSANTVRRALRHLRDLGVPICTLRHNGDGPTEYYWHLDRKLEPGEAGAYVSFMFLPEDEAQALLSLASPAGDTP